MTTLLAPMVVEVVVAVAVPLMIRSGRVEPAANGWLLLVQVIEYREVVVLSTGVAQVHLQPQIPGAIVERYPPRLATVSTCRAVIFPSAVAPTSTVEK